MKIEIENYENMTPEEKVAALEAYEPDMSGFVQKAAFDKAASDLAAAKKALREKQTEEEAQKAQAAEYTAGLEAKLKELEHKETVNAYVTSYLAMGYDEKMAKASAEALAKGDMDTVFKNQKAHAENQEKVIRAELLQQTPPPVTGDGAGAMGKDAFAKMSLMEKQKFAAENPEVYASFYEKKEE